MESPWTLSAAILIFDAALVLGAALQVRVRIVPGRVVLAWVLVMQAAWTFCYAMIILSPVEIKPLWLKLENVGMVSQPVFWLIFTLKYINPVKPVNRLLLAALCIIPVVSLTLLFSGIWFHFYYADTRLAIPNVGPLIITKRGVWYFPQLAQTYVLFIITTVILLRRLFKDPSEHQRRMGLLLIAVLAPWLVNLFYQIAATYSFTVPVDLTTVALTISAGLISTSVSTFWLFDLLPIARDVVMEHIPEMVVVVDAHDRVLDANSVARRWLGKTDKEIVGQDPMDVFRSWPVLINRFLLKHETSEEIEVGDPPRTIGLKVTAIYNQSGILQGRVIVAHDVTELKQANASLQAQLDVNESLRAKLEEQATRDPLTGVFNRRFFAETLDKEVSRAAREGKPVSIIILDLDFFKRFNDTYGHKCGDIMLQALADFLAKHTRSGDVVCRYGGEEFVILMPNTSLQNAWERGESLRAQYADMEVEYRGATLKATFSAGVASYPDHGTDGESVLYAADQALYQSKNEGRNRVTAFQGAHLNSRKELFHREEAKSAKDLNLRREEGKND